MCFINIFLLLGEYFLDFNKNLLTFSIFYLFLKLKRILGLNKEMKKSFQFICFFDAYKIREKMIYIYIFISNRKQFIFNSYNKNLSFYTFGLLQDNKKDKRCP